MAWKRVESLGSQLICYQWGKARFQVSDRLMGELEAALQEHLGQIAQAQLYHSGITVKTHMACRAKVSIPYQLV